MSIRWWCALVILVALPPACGNAPRDSGGRIVQLSPAMPLGESNFSVVIPEVALRGTAPRFARTEMNNGQVRIDSMIMPGRGSLRVQYAPDGFFGLQTEQQIRDRTAFIAWMARLLPSASGAKPTPDAPIAPVAHPHYRALGYTHLSQPGPDGRRCFAGRAAYRVKGRTIYDNDFGEADMVMEAIFCGSVSDTEEFARLFAQVSPRI
jgi:hypothetical protein